METKTMTRTHKIAGILALVAVALLPVAAVAQGADTGTANFSRYVAIGDSLTAAFASGGLVERYQLNSYPALIFQQVNGTTSGFQQPLVSEPGIPALLGLQSLSPLVIGRVSAGQGQPNNLTLPRPYDNLAVPGADVHDVLVTKTGGLFDLVLRPSAIPFTMLEQALALDPTFVSVWIGNNDVLGAATSGIVIDGVTLTTKAAFEADFRTIVGALAGRDLAIATIPDVTAIPFVNTIPPVVLNPATNEPVLVNGAPVFLIGPGGQLTPADKVLLSASTFLVQGIGVPAALGGTGQPLPDHVVLSGSEVAAISNRVNEINQVIRTVGNEAGAAIVDVNAVFSLVASEGYHLGGITFSTDFLTGGLFSYDGVHATQFGYAFVANLFLEAINAKYGGNIEPVNLATYAFSPDILLPQGADAPVQALYSNAAQRQLWSSTGVPSIEKLYKIKRSRELPRVPMPPRIPTDGAPGGPAAGGPLQ
jgi:hypothetical protein